MTFILGRSIYQNQARNKGLCSVCFKQPVSINEKTGLYKWKCTGCEKKQTAWQKRSRKR